MAVAKALGVPATSFLDLFHAAGLTTAAARDSGNISRACMESEPNKTIKSPPSLDHRYMHEDVGYGLVPFAALGELAGVPTPTIDALVHLSGLALGIDYARDGLTLEKLGLAGKSPARGSEIRARGRVSMEHEVLRKLRSAMQAAGYDALVALSQDNVTYTAGFLVPSHASNRFRRTITILAGERFAAQIVVNVEENLAKDRSRFSDIRAYNQFTQDPADLLADALERGGRRAPGASRSSSITCRRRTTSGCASGCRRRNSCRAASSISASACSRPTRRSRCCARSAA